MTLPGKYYRTNPFLCLTCNTIRTGVRNTRGKLKDGVNAISRYVINNFHDRLRQVVSGFGKTFAYFTIRLL